MVAWLLAGTVLDLLVPQVGIESTSIHLLCSHHSNLISRNQLSLPGSAAICRKKIASSSQGGGICVEDLEIREQTLTLMI